MSEVKELQIIKNKIDRIEDFSVPSQNIIQSIHLEGNHILEIPSLSVLKDIRAETVRVECEWHFSKFLLRWKRL